MPRGDRTGPTGMGPMTGRAAGYCSGSGMPGYMNPVPGRGYGMGFGRGRSFGGRGFGWRNMFYATGQPGWARFGGNYPAQNYSFPYQQPDADQEKEFLKNQAEALKSELDSIAKRLDEIETAKDE